MQDNSNSISKKSITLSSKKNINNSQSFKDTNPTMELPQYLDQTNPIKPIMPNIRNSLQNKLTEQDNIWEISNHDQTSKSDIHIPDKIVNRSPRKSVCTPKVPPRSSLGENPMAILLQNMQITEHIRYILTKPRDERNVEDMQFLIKVFVEGNFFATVDIDKFVANIVQYIEYKFYPKDSVIFYEGDKPEYFYIILKGLVKGLQTRKKNFGENFFTEPEKIFTIGTGKSFGELALCNNILRTCTICCCEDTELICLSKNAYQLLKSDMNTLATTELYDVIKKCQLFQGISKTVKKKLATRSLITSYPSNSVIIKQNETPFQLYIIKNGSLKVLRKIFKEEIDNDDEVNKAYHMEFNDIKDELILEVASLNKGEYVCDFELVRQIPMLNTVISTMPTILVHISIYEIMEILSENDVMLLQANIRNFSGNTELLTQYLYDNKWNRLKAKLKGEVLYKKNFESSAIKGSKLNKTERVFSRPVRGIATLMNSILNPSLNHGYEDDEYNCRAQDNDMPKIIQDNIQKPMTKFNKTEIITGTIEKKILLNAKLREEMEDQHGKTVDQSNQDQEVMNKTSQKFFNHTIERKPIKNLSSGEHLKTEPGKRLTDVSKCKVDQSNSNFLSGTNTTKNLTSSESCVKGTMGNIKSLDKNDKAVTSYHITRPDNKVSLGRQNVKAPLDKFKNRVGNLSNVKHLKDLCSDISTVKNTKQYSKQKKSLISNKNLTDPDELGKKLSLDFKKFDTKNLKKLLEGDQKELYNENQTHINDDISNGPSALLIKKQEFSITKEGNFQNIDNKEIDILRVKRQNEKNKQSNNKFHNTSDNIRRPSGLLDWDELKSRRKDVQLEDPFKKCAQLQPFMKMVRKKIHNDLKRQSSIKTNPIREAQINSRLATIESTQSNSRLGIPRTEKNTSQQKMCPIMTDSDEDNSEASDNKGSGSPRRGNTKEGGLNQLQATLNSIQSDSRSSKDLDNFEVHKRNKLRKMVPFERYLEMDIGKTKRDKANQNQTEFDQPIYNFESSNVKKLGYVPEFNKNTFNKTMREMNHRSSQLLQNSRMNVNNIGRRLSNLGTFISKQTNSSPLQQYKVSHSRRSIYGKKMLTDKSNFYKKN